MRMCSQRMLLPSLSGTVRSLSQRDQLHGYEQESPASRPATRAPVHGGCPPRRAGSHPRRCWPRQQQDLGRDGRSGRQRVLHPRCPSAAGPSTVATAVRGLPAGSHRNVMVQMAGLQQACPQAIRLPVAERVDAGRPVRCAGVPQADPELCYPSTAAPVHPVAERVDAGRPVRCAGVPQADPELCYPSTAAPVDTVSGSRDLIHR
jgi:hypothetical protein